MFILAYYDRFERKFLYWGDAQWEREEGQAQEFATAEEADLYRKNYLVTHYYNLALAQADVIRVHKEGDEDA